MLLVKRIIEKIIRCVEKYKKQVQRIRLHEFLTKNLWTVKTPFNFLLEIWQQTLCQKNIFYTKLEHHSTQERMHNSKAYVCSTTC